MRTNRKNKSRGDTSFCQVMEEARLESATRAWERATLASRLRHAAISSGRHRNGRRLGQIKEQAIERVVELVPQDVRVTIDTDYQVGLVSVRWNGHGRLHLPADVELPAPRIAQQKRSA